MAILNKNEIQNSFQRLFNAKNELLICSAFISPNFLTDLIEISKKNVNVKVVTSELNKDYYRSTLWLIDKFQNTPNFESKIIGNLHAKIYISDNKYAIHGSANLTDGALKKNIEQISVIEDPEEIIELKKIFDDIWKNGIEKKIDLKPKSQDSTFKKKPKTPNYQKEKAYSFEEIRKTYPKAYEQWNDYDDEFLNEFWSEKSNNQSRNEKIKELMRILGRSRGAIVSRLNKMGFVIVKELHSSHHLILICKKIR